MQSVDHNIVLGFYVYSSAFKAPFVIVCTVTASAGELKD